MTRLSLAGGIALLLGAALSCRRDLPRAASTDARSAAPLASAAPTGAQTSSARLADPRWRMAAGDDPLEHARLAGAEGASGLLDALADGGEVAATALRALPYADDAELSLAPLTERARTAAAAPLRPLLRTILEIAGRPARPREPLDPEGVRAAAERLLDLSRRRDLPADARALAISAARALSEQGYLAPAEIPSDLDPRSTGGGSAADPASTRP